MMAVYTTFWFDVEDYVSPRADDALAMLIREFEARGLRATWKLVGEKLRVLERRGRTDIIDMLSRQDLGYHTDFHSVHPTVAEYCEGLGWEEGRREFARREGPGYRDMIRVFGRTPSTYGQPGGGWVPHAYPVLTEWGIPTYIDETSHIGLDNQPFWYCGVLNVLNLGPNTHRIETADPGADVGEALDRFRGARAALEEAGSGLLQVFYHPCEYSCDEFWDAANFARGANPPRHGWRLPAQCTDDEMRRRVSVFGKFLDGILETGVRVVTASEVAALYADKAIGTIPGAPEIVEIAKALSGGALSPVGLDGYFLSPAECMWVLTGYLSKGEGVPVRTFLGPSVRIESTPGTATVDPTDFMHACAWVHEAMAGNGHIPSSMHIGGTRLSPPDFLATVAGAALVRLGGGSLPGSLPITKGRVILEDNITGEDAWGWIIFPEGFDAPRVIELGKLQAWSMKPAVLGK